MPEPLKAFFSPALVKRLAAELARAQPSFPSRAFIGQACAGLDELELLDRGRQIARALGDHLPGDYAEAVEILLRSLASPSSTEEASASSMGPFFYLPHTMFVSERGLEHFELSMRAQHVLTQRFTAEFSMRPFIAHAPERTLEVLREWTSDPDHRVRRLVSECTRIRLPWASRVPWLDAHPERVLELLERLKDDPSEYVRRSVANNLNDLSRGHRELMLATCASWLEDASPQRRKLVEHALRSLVKRCDPEALRLLGYGGKPSVAVEAVQFDPSPVKVGEKVAIRFGLRSTARVTQSLLVDVVVHFVKASGKTSPKVFKLDRVVLPPREGVDLTSRVSLAVHTTRKPYAGHHAVEVLVNGARFAAGGFEVVSAG